MSRLSQKKCHGAEYENKSGEIIEAFVQWDTTKKGWAIRSAENHAILNQTAYGAIRDMVAAGVKIKLTGDTFAAPETVRQAVVA